MQPGDTWFGSPPIKLPTRQKVDLGADCDLRARARHEARGAASSRRFTPRSRRCCSSPSATIAIDWCFSPTILERRLDRARPSASSAVERRHRADPVADLRHRDEMAADGRLQARRCSRCGRGGRCAPRRSRCSIGASPARCCSSICAARRSCPGCCACSARRSARASACSLDRHHRVRLRHDRRLRHDQRASRRCRPISTRTGS